MNLGSASGIIYPPGTKYDPSSKYNRPIMVPRNTTGLNGAFYTAFLSKRGPLFNHATGAETMTQVGEPDLFGNFAKCDYQNCFDTHLQSIVNPTMFVIARAPVPGLSGVERGLILSDWTNVDADVRGTAIEIRRATDRVQAFGYVTHNVGGVATSRSTGVDLFATDGADLAGFNIFLLGWNDGQYSGIGVYKPNLRGFTITNHATGITMPTGRNYRIGGHYSETDFMGKQDVAGAAFYQGLTSTTQFNAVGQYWYEVMMPQLGLR